MYCVRCGAFLSDNASKCPLCKTVVYHPDLPSLPREELFPEGKLPKGEKRYKIWQVILTAAFVLPLIIVLLCDLRYKGAVTWSGYVIGALAVGYVCFILPLWFRKPNPVIFVPCGCASGGLYVFYISLVTGGSWFLPFALPVILSVTVLVSAVVTLMKYLYRGRFYIFGGAFIILGGLMLLWEFLLTVTFEGIKFIGWSLYPLITLFLLGGLLIFLGICRPARESMERKLFI
ncbi:MAG: hypothetical protein IKL24_03540 [Clostridia bacterium]|nr:hypothetical protein [Clostridia bacterium]